MWAPPFYRPPPRHDWSDPGRRAPAAAAAAAAAAAGGAIVGMCGELNTWPHRTAEKERDNTLPDDTVPSGRLPAAMRSTTGRRPPRHRLGGRTQSLSLHRFTMHGDGTSCDGTDSLAGAAT